MSKRDRRPRRGITLLAGVALLGVTAGQLAEARGHGQYRHAYSLAGPYTGVSGGIGFHKGKDETENAAGLQGYIGWNFKRATMLEGGVLSAKKTSVFARGVLKLTLEGSGVTPLLKAGGYYRGGDGAEVNLMGGAGVMVPMAGKWSVRADWDYLHGERKTQAWTLGLMYEWF